MPDPDPHDDTSADYEQFEKAQLAQDRDVAGADTSDIDDATAQHLVNELIDAAVVTPVPEDRVLVHEPSGAAFDSPTQLAVFHQGWTPAHDADTEAE
ncbi:hypothetical protein HALDL1_00660 (plasmid) [Halobacterium sp. DL1]|jgi:hypothetical protein|uniref:hypothetical protein n=1 Tax=Halorubrum lacusprofundi TaxID=2247 RepID=UPI00022E66A5|nr:hypothetical protein [Halorubrum lacusprofundi]AHG05548.1 hypothetical protein HALDL1_00660 [Halobacterium sp. DL1]MCG1007499.1 hypothetical protein [Halorubrum lacusprofundi]